MARKRVNTRLIRERANRIKRQIAKKKAKTSPDPAPTTQVQVTSEEPSTSVAPVKRLSDNDTLSYDRLVPLTQNLQSVKRVLDSLSAKCILINGTCVMFVTSGSLNKNMHGLDVAVIAKDIDVKALIIAMHADGFSHSALGKYADAFTRHMVTVAVRRLVRRRGYYETSTGSGPSELPLRYFSVVQPIAFLGETYYLPNHVTDYIEAL